MQTEIKQSCTFIYKGLALKFNMFNISLYLLKLSFWVIVPVNIVGCFWLNGAINFNGET